MGVTLVYPVGNCLVGRARWDAVLLRLYPTAEGAKFHHAAAQPIRFFCEFATLDAIYRSRVPQEIRAASTRQQEQYADMMRRQAEAHRHQVRFVGK